QAHAGVVGVIVEWVSALFPDDPHGLCKFVGSALFVHADPREGWHPDWHTHVFNGGRRAPGARVTRARRARGVRAPGA
ncbi:hypothetical protein AAHH79_42665, partial [Burkholderia pseudomallei]